MDKNGELAGAVEASNNGSGSEGRLRLRPWVVAVSFAVGIHAYAASLWLSINLLDIPVEKHVVGADIAALLVPAMLLLALSLRAKPEKRADRRCFLLLCAALAAVTIPSNLLAQVILLPWLDRTPGLITYLGIAAVTYIIVFGAGLAAYKAVTIACGRLSSGESSGQ